jgi:hypothetical protein
MFKGFCNYGNISLIKVAIAILSDVTGDETNSIVTSCKTAYVRKRAIATNVIVATDSFIYPFKHFVLILTI